MKNKGLIITLIVFLSLIAISLLVFMISVINGSFNIKSFSNSYKVSNSIIYNETYNQDFEDIVVNTNSSDINIYNSDSNEIKVLIYGKENKADVSNNNNTLNISYKEKSCIGFCFNNTISKIEIYIPSTYSNIISINNDYGDINIDKFSNATINIEEDCGDVKVKEANNITIENDYGDIKINKVNNYLNIKEDCGDVKIDNLNINKNSKIYNDYGDIKIDNTNDIYIKAKTDLGDTKINKNNRKADTILDIKNDCGDIIVNN